MPGMPSFQAADGTEIAYAQWGSLSGTRPVVLHHGFISNFQHGWVQRGVVAALTGAGHAVVAIDARGHGLSGKPHDPRRYGEDQMARDLSQLLDVLAVGEIDLVGYSMGAIVSLIAATREPRVRRLVTGGVGAAVAELGGADTRAIPRQALVAALRADDPATVTDPRAAAFRMYADLVGGDRLALAAQAEAMHTAPIPLDRITAPTLVIAGDHDDLAARPEVLAAAIPGAEVLVLPGDHLSVPASQPFAAALTGFLR